MDVKTLRHIEIKSEDRGEVEAVFATFNEVDDDGDVTLPGAFQDGAQMPISAYGHRSWDGMLPVGRATIRSSSTEAILSGQFFMDTTDGRDTFTTVKRLAEAGLGQWSYGYDALEFSFGEFDGRKVRFLAKQLVHEVSPVLRGAGVGTRTLSAKSSQQRYPEVPAMTTLKTAIRPHETDVVNRPWDADAVLTAVADGTSIADLRSMAAWVDPGADPETKGAYRFWHHEGPRGAANVRACVTGIAVLNGSRGGTTIPDGDRQGVYDHLAAHMRDADREPPELRAAGGIIKDTGGGDLLSEIVASLVGTHAVSAAVGRLVAPADGKTRKLSKSKAEYLDWLIEDMEAATRKLRAYRATPDDEGVREYLRFIRQSVEGASTP